MYIQEEQAIKFVIKAFSGEKRNKEDIDLSFHSISVGFMLKNIGCSAAVVVTGLLHDIIEDTNFGYEDIKTNFGEKIANYVLIVSEDMAITNWKDRKGAFIERMYQQNNDILFVELADKLHNLLSDYDLFVEKGNDALVTKNADYEEHKWFYLKLRDLFVENLPNNELLERYIKITDVYFK